MAEAVLIRAKCRAWVGSETNLEILIHRPKVTSTRDEAITVVGHRFHDSYGKEFESAFLH